MAVPKHRKSKSLKRTKKSLWKSKSNFIAKRALGKARAILKFKSSDKNNSSTSFFYPFTK